MKYQFLAPWRLERASPNEQLVQTYLQRIQQSRAAELVVPKSQPQNAQAATQFLTKEIQKLDGNGLVLLCLDERGKNHDSETFAALLESYTLQAARQICFVVGGAYGIPADLTHKGRLELLSLSRMTLPHELALVVLLEQVYRAHCILARHPYHHGAPSDLARSLGKA